jgi:hypothetical protein
VSSRGANQRVEMALTEVATPSLHSQEQRREASKVTLVRRLQRLVCSALAMGAVPRHVAFIMDGNRRYASAARVDRAQGHAHGFEKARPVGLPPPIPAGAVHASLLLVTATLRRPLLRARGLVAAAGRPGVVPRPGRQRGHRLRVQHRELQGARETSSASATVLFCLFSFSRLPNRPLTASALPTKWPRSWPSRETSWASWSAGCLLRRARLRSGRGLGSESWATCSCFPQTSASPPPGS